MNRWEPRRTEKGVAWTRVPDHVLDRCVVTVWLELDGACGAEIARWRRGSLSTLSFPAGPKGRAILDVCLAWVAHQLLMLGEPEFDVKEARRLLTSRP